MSLPVVLPGSCCPVSGAAQHSEPPHRSRPRGLSASSRLTGGGSRQLLPGRPLLSLGLLQLLLGGSMVALSFGALSLSNSPPIRNSCPFWAGSSVSSPRPICGSSPGTMRAPVRGCSRLCGAAVSPDLFIILLIFPHFQVRNDTQKCNNVRVVVTSETYQISAPAVQPLGGLVVAFSCKQQQQQQQ